MPMSTVKPSALRTLSRRLGPSPATLRNVIAIWKGGLLFGPTSAGRLPTDLGLRLFVDA